MRGLGNLLLIGAITFVLIACERGSNQTSADNTTEVEGFAETSPTTTELPTQTQDPVNQAEDMLNQTEDDILNQTEDAVEQAVEQVRAVEVSSARSNAETELEALRTELAADNNYEAARTRLQQVRDTLAATYEATDDVAQAEWQQLQAEFDRLGAASRGVNASF
jgi:ElaB/YqjD/DUF883 family membrane-anchored ribosome-binding protein